MRFTRELYKGISGEDVRYMKELLLALHCYDPEITSLKKDRFGSDTRRAVKTFQGAKGLPVTGAVDRVTWEAVIAAAMEESGEPLGGEPGEEEPEGGQAQPPLVGPGEGPQLPDNLGVLARFALLQALGGTAGLRQKIVLTALSFAYDPQMPRPYPISLYIWGGNLYNRDLTPNVITKERIAKGASRTPAYYDGGRREMMERAVEACPGITGADCSGGVVGLFRHLGLVAPTFDTTANGFFSSGRMEKIQQSALRPGDLLHRDGHVGMYAGAGFAVEWMGGAYGCQLTMLENRMGRNFVSGSMDRKSPWTGFLRPSYYE